MCTRNLFFFIAALLLLLILVAALNACNGPVTSLALLDHLSREFQLMEMTYIQV